MYSQLAGQKLLFNPVLDNPLHGGDGSVLVKDVTLDAVDSNNRKLNQLTSPPSLSARKSILKQSNTTSPNLHVRWSEPLYEVRTFLTQAQESLPPLHVNNVNLNKAPTSIPVAPTMKLIPAFLLVPEQGILDQTVQHGMVPVLPFMHPFQTDINMENMTRANLLPLMATKGIMDSQSTPMSNNQISHGTHTQFDAIPPAAPFMPIAIQAANISTQPPMPPGSSIDGDVILKPVPSKKNTPGSSGKQAHISPNHSFPIRKPKTTKHHPTPYNRVQTNSQQSTNDTSDVKHPSLHIQLINWGTSLDRCLYLMEHGSHDEKNHKELTALLAAVNEIKHHPDLNANWLRRARLVDILKKYENKDSIYDYSVRDMAGAILQAWRNRFRNLL